MSCGAADCIPPRQTRLPCALPHPWLQTNIGFNNNKFYIIQLLQHQNGSFALWTRWGRVGELGQNAMKAQGNEAAAIKVVCERILL